MKKEKKRRKLLNPNLPPHIAKLLVFAEGDNNYIAYKLGTQCLYLVSVTELRTSVDNKIPPKIVTIRYTLDSAINEFLKKSGIRALRIFKSANFRKKARTRAFFYNAANNVLGIVQKFANAKAECYKGKNTLRIKSDCLKLRKELYDICVEVNKEGKFGCTFDYDEWDVLMELRKYKVGNKTWMIITTKGLDSYISNKKST